jgi:hypothetical protein
MFGPVQHSEIIAMNKMGYICPKGVLILVAGKGAIYI